MSLNYPDNLKHQNPANPLVEDVQFKGGFMAVADEAARNAIPEPKRKQFMAVGYFDGSSAQIKQYTSADVTDPAWIDDSNWEGLAVGFDPDSKLNSLPIQTGNEPYTQLVHSTGGAGTAQITDPKLSAVYLDAEVVNELGDYNNPSGTVRFSSHWREALDSSNGGYQLKVVCTDPVNDLYELQFIRYPDSAVMLSLNQSGGVKVNGQMLINQDSSGALQVDADGDARIRLNDISGGETYTEMAFATNGVDRWGIYGADNGNNPGDKNIAIYDYVSGQDRVAVYDDHSAVNAPNGNPIIRAENGIMRVYGVGNVVLFYNDGAGFLFNPNQVDQDFRWSTANVENAMVLNSDAGTPANEKLEVKLPLHTEDVEVTDPTKGVILRSPDNTRWRITVDNSGNLTTTPA